MECGCAYIVHDDLLLESGEVHGIKSPLDPSDLPLREIRVSVQERIEKYGCYRPTLILPPYPDSLKRDCLIDKQNHCDYKRFLRDLELIEGERRNINLLVEAYRGITRDLEEILTCNIGVRDPWKMLITVQKENYKWAEKTLLKSLDNQDHLRRFKKSFDRSEEVLRLCS